MAKLDTSFKVKGEITKEDGRYVVVEVKTGERIDLEAYIDSFIGKDVVDVTIKESKEVGSQA